MNYIAMGHEPLRGKGVAVAVPLCVLLAPHAGISILVVTLVIILAVHITRILTSARADRRVIPRCMLQCDSSPPVWSEMQEWAYMMHANKRNFICISGKGTGKKFAAAISAVAIMCEKPNLQNTSVVAPRVVIVSDRACLEIIHHHLSEICIKVKPHSLEWSRSLLPAYEVASEAGVVLLDYREFKRDKVRVTSIASVSLVFVELSTKVYTYALSLPDVLKARTTLFMHEWPGCCNAFDVWAQSIPSRGYATPTICWPDILGRDTDDARLVLLSKIMYLLGDIAEPASTDKVTLAASILKDPTIIREVLARLQFDATTCMSIGTLLSDIGAGDMGLYFQFTDYLKTEHSLRIGAAFKSWTASLDQPLQTTLREAFNAFMRAP